MNEVFEDEINSHRNFESSPKTTFHPVVSPKKYHHQQQQQQQQQQQYQKENYVNQRQQQEHESSVATFPNSTLGSVTAVTNSGTTTNNNDKIESLANIRTIGCMNPMAYTLWNHSMMFEDYNHHELATQMAKTAISSSSSTTMKQSGENESFTIQEDMDLLNYLDSTDHQYHHYLQSTSVPQSPKLFVPLPSHDNDDTDASALVTKPTERNNTKQMRSMSNCYDMIRSNVAAPIIEQNNCTNMDEHLHNYYEDDNRMTLDFDESRHPVQQKQPDDIRNENYYTYRRHSLPASISKPIAIRPSISSPKP